jgi:hypothetical protein
VRMRGMIRNAYLWAHARSNGRVFTVGLVTPYARACGLSEVTMPKGLPCLLALGPQLKS